MKILLIQLDFEKWNRARAWSYAAQFSYEEGFASNDVHYTTVISYDEQATCSWVDRIQSLFRGRKFDQVWLEAVHSNFNDSFINWISEISDIRVALLGESLTYTQEEIKDVPVLQSRIHDVSRKLEYMTHVLASDEHDVDYIQDKFKIPAKWWVHSIPERVIKHNGIKPVVERAIFSGSVYGDRRKWMDNSALASELLYVASPENRTVYPRLFNIINSCNRMYLKYSPFDSEAANNAYVSSIRKVRKRCFDLWLEGLETGYAVVQLPHLVKAFPGRVYESMAIGRPVITMEIKNRPRVMGLFEPGKEILFYSQDDPDDLLESILRLKKDKVLQGRIVESARKKILCDFTVEKRVGQILQWIDSGKEESQ